MGGRENLYYKASQQHSGEDQLFGVMQSLVRPFAFEVAELTPIESRGRTDEIGAGLEGDAALGLDLLQLVERGEKVVDENRVSEGPEIPYGL